MALFRFVFSLLVLTSVVSAWGHPTNYMSAVLTAGPAAYWRLNETSGSTANDLAGTNHGTIQNATLGAVGAPPPTFAGLPTNGNNLPLGFNGANAYVQTPLRLNGNQGTFIALVSLDGVQSSGATICVARGSGANVCALDMQGDGMNLQYVWANDPGTWNFNPGFAPPPNQWTFVAISVTPSNQIMYMDAGNGLRAATNTHTHGTVSLAGPLNIGGDPLIPNRYFDGRIAEVAVFNRALTPAEVISINQFAAITVSTNYPAAVMQAGPTAYWRMNETSGTVARDIAGGRHGTNRNMILGTPGPPLSTFAGMPTNNLAYLFNGTNGFVQTPLNLSSNRGTFMALINPIGTQSSGDAICIARGSGANVCALDMQGDGVNLQYVWANDSGTWNFNPGFAPPPNQWSFIAITVTPTNAVMYLDYGDGLKAATNVHNHATVNNAGPMALGGDPLFGSRYFNGRIAEMAIFNRALSFAEVKAINQFVTISNSTAPFEPVRFRPLPQQTLTLTTNSVLLDGAWVINPNPGANILTVPLNGPGWSPIQVPGQWKQQGFNVSQSQPVAMAKNFTVPQNWNGQRIILRFDAIHAGTTYWLNGQMLGYSENLFTPVEWDITDSVLPGQTNRIDLNMVVDTVSESLAYASGYAFHNVGGIHRSVRVFALPPTHINQLRLNAGLDANFINGTLALKLGLVSGQPLGTNITVTIGLTNAASQSLQPSVSQVVVPTFTNTTTVELNATVPKPLQWSAEKPNLYELTIELRQGATLLERVVRNVGFRTVKVQGRLLYVNGRSVKIAGICHHEIDPLTGRANTARHAETDVRMLKEANLNYIRTTHYPPTAELLDAADRLGMYVEDEAPFTWVFETLPNTSTYLNAVLRPTSAMVDYDHAHPSIIMWSVANESSMNSQFVAATALIREMDPTRPITFNNPESGVADVANLHYASYPYDGGFANDSRPVYLGEYFFEITHEQTDVSINPGLRELWGHGHAEPDSQFAQALIPGFSLAPLKPGLRPGGWSFMYHSDHVIGGAIFAAHDDAFYFSATEHAGYAWHHGFWGLIDSWRRPKPEWWLARHIFSPVWLLTRHPAFTAGQASVQVPVENRYVFTDFNELSFIWKINGQHGQIFPTLAPGTAGQLVIPVPVGSQPGDTMSLLVTNTAGVVVTEAMLWLGSERAEILPQPSGAPTWTDDGNKIFIRGAGFGLVFNRAIGNFDPSDTRHQSAVNSFPTVHVTRYDFGDLNGPNSPPYAVFPNPQTRVFGNIQVQQVAAGLQLTVNESYQSFSGTTTWLIDRVGRGTISYDYTYTGTAMDTREAGIRFLLNSACDTVQWRRWSEWGIFPEESLSRIEGVANARRDPTWGPAIWNQRPEWPWVLDETELGTTDFRSVKFNIYEAKLGVAGGPGLTAHANADAHFRAALQTNGVAAYVLSRCPLAQVRLNPGNHIQGQFNIELNGLELQAARTNGGLVLSWPVSAVGFVLESTGNLNPPNWTSVLIPPVTNGTRLNVTVPVSGERQFFRLNRP